LVAGDAANFQQKQRAHNAAISGARHASHGQTYAGNATGPDQISQTVANSFQVEKREDLEKMEISKTTQTQRKTKISRGRITGMHRKIT